MKHLRQVTKDILQSVELVTGKSVQLMRDENLTVLAALSMARNGADFHVLRYKPSNEPMDYLVAHQAGYLLRLYECSPEKRFDFTVTGTGDQTVASLLTANGKTSDQDGTDMDVASKMLTQWTLMNLRSLPIGMRIDDWISSQHPELKDLQSVGIAMQQQQNINLLSHKIAGHYIPSPLMGPVSAFAMFADRLLGVDQFATPFVAAGLQNSGAELLKIWDEIPKAATNDCELVDAWAMHASIRNWYEWTLYKS
jgi:hypothetical protein